VRGTASRRGGVRAASGLRAEPPDGGSGQPVSRREQCDGVADAHRRKPVCVGRGGIWLGARALHGDTRRRPGVPHLEGARRPACRQPDALPFGRGRDCGEAPARRRRHDGELYVHEHGPNGRHARRNKHPHSVQRQLPRRRHVHGLARERAYLAGRTRRLRASRPDERPGAFAGADGDGRGGHALRDIGPGAEPGLLEHAWGHLAHPARHAPETRRERRRLVAPVCVRRGTGFLPENGGARRCVGRGRKIRTGKRGHGPVDPPRKPHARKALSTEKRRARPRAPLSRRMDS